MTKEYENRLKELRVENKMNQEDMAAVFEVNPRTISAWENNRKQPSAQTWIEMARYFDVSLNYLLGLTNIRRPFGVDGPPPDAAPVSFRADNLAAYALFDGLPVLLIQDQKPLGWGLVDAKSYTIRLKNGHILESGLCKITCQVAVPNNT